MKSLILILAIISTSRAVTFDCNDFTFVGDTGMPSTYSCWLPTVSNVHENESLTAVYGQHQSGKTNEDVKHLAISYTPQLTFFPRAIENFFPNLEAIDFWSTDISTLTGDELDPFPNLFWFRIVYNRKLERIPGNLFASTPRMTTIALFFNNIKHVGADAFSNLPNLIYLDLGDNYCVSEFAVNNTAEVLSLIEHVRTNCTDIDVTTSTTTTLSTTPITTTTTPTTTTTTTTPTTATTTPITTTLEDISSTTTSEDSTSTTSSEDQTTTTTSEETSTESSTTSDHEEVIITCREKLSKALNTNFKPQSYTQSSCEVPASPTPFKISLGNTRTRVEISVESVVDGDMLLIYFPSSFDPFHEHNNDESLSCMDFSSLPIIINDLTPSVPYLFCVLYSDPQVISPYQCQSFMVEKRTPWILQEDQMLVIYSVVGAFFMAFLIGVAIAYLIVFQFPTLLRGSLKVTIMQDHQDLNLEEKKRPDVPDPPIYLTPLPRIPREQQPIVRSASDSTWKHYSFASDYPNRLSYDFTYDNDYARGYIIPLEPYGTSVEALMDSDHSIVSAKPPRAQQKQLNYGQESPFNRNRNSGNDQSKENLYTVVI